jgi:hypothetical protein
MPKVDTDRLVYLEYRQSTQSLRASNVVDALWGQSCNHFPLCDCGDPRLTMCDNCRNAVWLFRPTGESDEANALTFQVSQASIHPKRHQ